jgi:hypothetical protein
VIPGIGDAHGFHTTVVLGAGPHVVCAYGIDVGEGNGNTTLGCRSIAG